MFSDANNDGYSSQDPQNFPLVFFIVVIIVTNILILAFTYYRRRKYKVDTSRTRILYYEEMPNIIFKPKQDNVRRSNPIKEQIQSRNCFRPDQILTQIPCYIIEVEFKVPSTVTINNCNDCRTLTKTISVSQFGKAKIPVYVWAILLLVLIPGPALLYFLLCKKIIWTRYFCECGQQKPSIIEQSD